MSELFTEHAVCFECEGDTLIGIVAQPAKPIGRRGVLIVVGGPQYRVGSHRQFLLLSRYLASRGIATMRFDYRGMGDSTGDLRDFEAVTTDIRAAVDCFVESVPLLEEVVLWGLCDAASAAAFYAHQDPRISGLVLLNPWVRTQAGEAKAYLKHYYVQRLFDGDLWRRMVTGRFDFGASLCGAARIAARVAGIRSERLEDPKTKALSLPERMADGIERFHGRVMLVLSGNDLTAREFNDAIAVPRWMRLLAAPRVSRVDVAAANHTFSTRIWRELVAARTYEWMLKP